MTVFPFIGSLFLIVTLRDLIGWEFLVPFDRYGSRQEMKWCTQNGGTKTPILISYFVNSEALHVALSCTDHLTKCLEPCLTESFSLEVRHSKTIRAFTVCQTLCWVLMVSHLIPMITLENYLFFSVRKSPERWDVWDYPDLLALKIIIFSHVVLLWIRT